MKEQSNPDDLHIRLAVVADMDEMMKLAMAACAENGFVNPNPGRMAAAIWPALNQDHGLCGVIGRQGGKIEGAVLLKIGNPWYSDDLTVEEVAIFVLPEFRSAEGGRAKKLCEFSKTVADTLALPLTIGVLSNARTAAKVRMYKRQFGEPAGAFFLYNASTITKAAKTETEN